MSRPSWHVRQMTASCACEHDASAIATGRAILHLPALIATACLLTIAASMLTGVHGARAADDATDTFDAFRFTEAPYPGAGDTAPDAEDRASLYFNECVYREISGACTAIIERRDGLQKLNDWARASAYRARGALYEAEGNICAAHIDYSNAVALYAFPGLPAKIAEINEQLAADCPKPTATTLAAATPAGDAVDTVAVDDSADDLAARRVLPAEAADVSRVAPETGSFNAFWRTVVYLGAPPNGRQVFAIEPREPRPQSVAVTSRVADSAIVDLAGDPESAQHEAAANPLSAVTAAGGRFSGPWPALPEAYRSMLLHQRPKHAEPPEETLSVVAEACPADGTGGHLSDCENGSQRTLAAEQSETLTTGSLGPSPDTMPGHRAYGLTLLAFFLSALAIAALTIRGFPLILELPTRRRNGFSFRRPAKAEIVRERTTLDGYYGDPDRPVASEPQPLMSDDPALPPPSPAQNDGTRDDDELHAQPADMDLTAPNDVDVTERDSDAGAPAPYQTDSAQWTARLSEAAAHVAPTAIDAPTAGGLADPAPDLAFEPNTAETVDEDACATEPPAPEADSLSPDEACDGSDATPADGALRSQPAADQLAQTVATAPDHLTGTAVGGARADAPPNRNADAASLDDANGAIRAPSARKLARPPPLPAVPSAPGPSAPGSSAKGSAPAPSIEPKVKRPALPQPVCIVEELYRAVHLADVMPRLARNDLAAVCRGEQSIVVLDGYGRFAEQLASFRNMAPHMSQARLLFLDPSEDNMNGLFNPFLADVTHPDPFRAWARQNAALDVHGLICEQMFGARFVGENRLAVRHLLELVLRLPEASYRTLREAVRPNNRSALAQQATLVGLQGTAQGIERASRQADFSSALDIIEERLAYLLEDRTFAAAMSDPLAQPSIAHRIGEGCLIVLSNRYCRLGAARAAALTTALLLQTSFKPSGSAPRPPVRVLAADMRRLTGSSTPDVDNVFQSIGSDGLKLEHT